MAILALKSPGGGEGQRMTPVIRWGSAVAIYLRTDDEVFCRRSRAPRGRPPSRPRGARAVIIRRTSMPCASWRYFPIADSIDVWPDGSQVGGRVWVTQAINNIPNVCVGLFKHPPVSKEIRKVVLRCNRCAYYEAFGPG